MKGYVKRNITKKKIRNHGPKIVVRVTVFQKFQVTATWSAVAPQCSFRDNLWFS
jgi:hypothetical protein